MANKDIELNFLQTTQAERMPIRLIPQFISCRGLRDLAKTSLQHCSQGRPK